MASVRETAVFFGQGSSAQFEYVLGLYPQVLKLKAQSKCKRPDDLIQLDDWYQNKLPQLIKKRGKDRHIVHEELVKTMKWKQTRGKFFPQLSYLIKVNTPRAVQAETRKAFRKLPNLEQAITALSNLKGVGITMASALLAAAAPETAPFMADECLMAIPEIEGIDYTTREYMNFVKLIRTATDRLNRECHPDERPDVADDETKGEGPTITSNNSSSSSSSSSRVTESASKSKSTATDGNGPSPAAADGSEDGEDSNSSSSDGSSTELSPAKTKPDPPNATLPPLEKKWSPHRVELALWTHYVASELQPELLEHIPENASSTPISSSTVTEGDALTNASATCSTNSVNNHNATDSTQSSGGTNGGSTFEEPSDESNGDTGHGKDRLGTDESSKDNKLLNNLDECTEGEDSRGKPNQDTVSSRQHRPPQEQVESRQANNNRSRTDSGSDDSPSNPKRTLEDDGQTGAEEETAPPASKKSKFG